jgi:hypothetical protein
VFVAFVALVIKVTPFAVAILVTSVVSTAFVVIMSIAAVVFIPDPAVTGNWVVKEA